MLEKAVSMIKTMPTPPMNCIKERQMSMQWGSTVTSRTLSPVVVHPLVASNTALVKSNRLDKIKGTVLSNIAYSQQIKTKTVPLVFSKSDSVFFLVSVMSKIPHISAIKEGIKKCAIFSHSE